MDMDSLCKLLGDVLTGPEWSGLMWQLSQFPTATWKDVCMDIVQKTILSRERSVASVGKQVADVDAKIAALPRDASAGMRAALEAVRLPLVQRLERLKAELLELRKVAQVDERQVELVKAKR